MTVQGVVVIENQVYCVTMCYASHSIQVALCSLLLKSKTYGEIYCTKLYHFVPLIAMCRELLLVWHNDQSATEQHYAYWWHYLSLWLLKVILKYILLLGGCQQEYTAFSEVTFNNIFCLQFKIWTSKPCLLCSVSHIIKSILV